jgi:hypothetical protein
MANKDLIRYDLLVQEALKGVVRRLLTDAAKDGLPGEHHFFISFRTDGPGVRIAQRLRDKYPQEMTIALQHQFWDLRVTEHTFEVGLSFNGIPERLLIPFDALTKFVDPSVQFGLRFALDEDEEEEGTISPPARPAGPAPAPVELKPAPVVPVIPKGAPAKAEDGPAGEDSGAQAEKPAAKDEAGGTAEVVSLDAFRKKN